jgi:hypothetical protein
MSPKEAKPVCRNCGKPLGPGSADGLDNRCYKYHRRTGTLPPAKSAYGTMSAAVSVKMDSQLAELVERAAKLDDLSMAEWVRRACAVSARQRVAQADRRRA